MSLNGIQKPEPKAIYVVGTQPPVDTNSPDTSVNGADSGYTDVCPETSLKELIKSETPLSSAQVAGKLLEMDRSCISPGDIATFLNTRPGPDLRARTFAPLLADEAVPEETKSKIGEKNSIRQAGENNSQYGTCWISHELVGSKRINKEFLPEFIEQGWIKGRNKFSMVGVA